MQTSNKNLNLSCTLLLFMSLMTGCGQNSEAPGTIELKIANIVGGSTVDPTATDSTFMVSVGNSCAGSIIAPKWILTAAHCKPYFNGPITAGSVNRLDPKRIPLKLLRAYVHPKYDSPKGQNDFALLELETPIDFKVMSNLSVISINDSNVAEGMMATVMGWGNTSENGAQSSVLKQVDVPLVSREVGNAAYGYTGPLNESMIFAGFDIGGKDSCQGDSGGPLVAKDVNGVLTLIGVVSIGKGCARAGKYGIYSNVAYANEWINSTIHWYLKH